ncbi:unnamed protein product [Leptosia nina]|uniref:Uncharacterized protein n=1 Tax=Leptosia nina TaxID=320188 RepID=A0AAV1JKR2_9NEOP
MKKCDAHHNTERVTRERTANDRDPLIKPPIAIPEDPHDNQNLVRLTQIALGRLSTNVHHTIIMMSVTLILSPLY